MISVTDKPKLTRGRPKGIRSPAAIEYARIRHEYPMLPKKLAAAAAGYSKGTHPAAIDGGQVMQDIERQKELAIRKLGVTIEDQMRPLVNIRDGKAEQSSDKISSIKVLNSMIPGYVAEERKTVSIRGLFVELKDVTTGDLAEFLGENANG